MGDNERADTLILLVGSNPLPNYLAAMALKPSQVRLVHSDETRRPKERLHAALSADFGSGTIIDGDAYVNDPFSASAVADKVLDLIASGNSAHLHYTGGTKVMSAHALKAFYKKGGQPENASYLDEAKACLRFDDGRSRSLSDCGVSLTLDRIFQLHDIQQGKPRERPGDEWIDRVTTAELKAKGSSKEIADLPDKDKWRLFIDGEWLEEWVRLRIQGLLPDGYDMANLVAGVQCVRGTSRRKLEVDIAFVHNYRTFLISCATSNDLKRCKAKAFEIGVRSRQMAGDLARSAVVCLLDGVDNNDGRKFVDLLRDDVQDAWGCDNQILRSTTRIYGREDVLDWSGHYGSPNLGSLKEWLES